MVLAHQHTIRVSLQFYIFMLAPPPDTLRVPSNSNLPARCWRANSSSKFNSRPSPNPTYLHHTGAPAPARDTLYVPLPFQLLFIMPADLPQLEIQFAFPSNSSFPPILHADAPNPTRDPLR